MNKLPRTGIGYDVHAFDVRKPLKLGGVHIPEEAGLKGHSDADVLIHAIIDALLGAAASGDIGYHFPDTDPRYKDADSRGLLRATLDILTGQGFKIGNIDATIMAEQPKMNPHIPDMRKTIANDLGLHVPDVSVKATTTEKLGFVGRSEGMACIATVLIYREE